MATTTLHDQATGALYKARKGKVDFIDVPEIAFVVVDGAGAPGGPAFTDAIQALYTVSYTAHFAVKKATGEAPRVMPLEALWWMENAEAQALMRRVAAGRASMAEADPDQSCWLAMIAQLPPIDETVVAHAIEESRKKKDIASLAAVRYECWTEGPSAQILHVGPYSTESTSIVALHREIAEHGFQPRGRHHEIYLGDPRTAAPERLRTILRQPIEPVP